MWRTALTRATPEGQDDLNPVRIIGTDSRLRAETLKL